MTCDKPRFRLALLAETILYKLYEAHLDDETGESFALHEIKEMYSVPVPQKLIACSLEFLRTEASQQQIIMPINRYGKKGSYRYAISSEGILKVERELRRQGSLLLYYMEHGDDDLDKVAGFDALFMTLEEEFDDAAWRPIVLDRNTAEFHELLSSIESSVDKIRADNEFAVTFPEERAGIMQSLTDGINKLKKESPTAKQLDFFIIQPLHWICTNFAKSALAATAAETVKALLSFIKNIL